MAKFDPTRAVQPPLFLPSIDRVPQSITLLYVSPEGKILVSLQYIVNTGYSYLNNTSLWNTVWEEQGGTP